jgi:Flp pilus assembly protein TadG
MSARQRVRGAAAVEFALVATVLFTLLGAIADFGYLFYVNLTMQHAVREGARVGVINGSLAPAIDAMKAQSMGLWDSVSPTVTIERIDGSGGVVKLPPNSFGSSSDIVVFTVDCTSPLLTGFIKPVFPNGQYQFTVSATMRIE